MRKSIHLNSSVSLCLCGMLVAALSGCSTMAPTYEKPAAPVNAAWPRGEAYQAAAVQAAPKAAAEIPWREFFVDQQLQQIIELALKNNRDLRVAALNIERARALYQIRRADLLPHIDASAAANVQRIPVDLSPGGKSVVTEQYNVGLGLSTYEVDLFGRVRSLKDQALEQYLSTEQAQRSLRISLVSQMAAAWLAMAADRERLSLARMTLANQMEAYKLVNSRYEAGVSSALDLNQARTSVDSARVEIARYTTLVAQDENGLNLLVGSSVSADLLPQSLSTALTSLKDIKPGTPSDVLLSRPDILQAEGDLKAANANIGAARAAFFPRITLVSSVGLGSDELSGLFKGGAFAWSFAPRITLPIFDGGTNKANLAVAEVDRSIAVARYEKAIQSAFREVADSLAQRGTIDEQLSAQQSLTDATAESLKLSQARYDKGVDGYLSVLDSQRSLYAARLNLIGVRLASQANLVSLYKVLGGGLK